MAAKKDAEFCAVELEDGAFGLSYMLLGRSVSDLAARLGASDVLAGQPALEVAQGFAGSDPLRRAIGLATLNALTQSVWRRLGYAPPCAGNSLGEMRPRPGETVGMVGFFPPLVAQVLSCGARLVVVELDPQTVAREQGAHPELEVTLDRRALGRCQRVLATSTMLLNDTLDAMLGCAQGAESFAVIGPSAGCWPDPLFARGVSLVGGTRITDPEHFRRAMADGSSWGGAAEKYAIARGQWPGWEDLLR